MSRRAVGLACGTAAVALALTACAGDPPPPAPVTTPATTPATRPVTVPATVRPPTTPPAAGAAVPAEPAQASWTMPDLVGRNLQDAQDTIQALTDFGIPVTASHDATGAGREQVLDRNWKVCTQNVRAGTTITTDTRIDFGAVQLDEDC